MWLVQSNAVIVHSSCHQECGLTWALQAAAYRRHCFLVWKMYLHDEDFFDDLHQLIGDGVWNMINQTKLRFCIVRHVWRSTLEWPECSHSHSDEVYLLCNDAKLILLKCEVVWPSRWEDKGTAIGFRITSGVKLLCFVPAALRSFLLTLRA